MSSNVVHAWTFQGGRHFTITIGNTAGNATTNLTPTMGKRWILMRGSITLVCDATVVNRNIVVQLTDGTSITTALPLGPNTAATLTSNYYLNEINFNLNGIVASALNALVGINGILLEGADQFRILINAGVAGDSYSGYIDVLEIDI